MDKEISGAILIDKPKGKTSPEITRKISELLETKSGHCGALDPFATGVLPVLVGKAVKLQEHLQKKDKEYLVTIEAPLVTKKELEKALGKFKGKIKQVPPEKSAVKRRERTRKIYEIEYKNQKNSKHKFKVKCQHGTYIRTLVKDLSKEIGKEINLKELRRTKAGKWSTEDTKKLGKALEDLELYKKGKIKIEDAVTPLKKAIKDYPRIKIKETATKSISHGEDLKTPGIDKIKGEIKKGQVVILENSKEVIAVGKSLYNSEQIKKKERGTVIKTNKVIKIPREG